MLLVKKNVILISFLIFLLSGCAQREAESENIGTSDVESLIKFRTVAQNGATVAVSDINCYLFKDNVYYKSLRGITPNADGTLSLKVVLGTKLYFLTNMAEPTSFGSLVAGTTTEEQFLKLRSDEAASHASDRAPEFYSGLFDTKTMVEGENKILLKTSVARIDLDLTSDVHISVNRVEITDASATAPIFGGESPLSSTVTKSYEHVYTVPVLGLVQDACRIYESNTPVSFKVYGMFDGVPFTCTSQTSHIERNKIYTIRVSNAGASFTGSFDIKDWEPGDTIQSKPDVTGQIRLNVKNSVLPDGVVVNEDSTMLGIPHTGGAMQVAFLSDGPVDLVSVVGENSSVTIDHTPRISSEGAKVLTKYDVTILPQGNGSLSYSVDLRLKSAFREHDYDKMTLQVAESPQQIQTATMVGKTWMAFNTRSNTLEDQVYLTDGSSVEQMYSDNWVSSIGCLFQCGRNYAYTPWKAGTDNQGGVSTGIPWVKDEHMPCPPGYRVPSRAELRSLLPDGQAIPGTFTSNGDQLKVEIMRSNPQDISIGGITGKGNYLRITSLTSGEKLFIPMSGQKSSATVANPDFGKGFTLWSSENAGAPARYGWVIHFWPGTTAASGAMGSGNHTELVGLAYVRCIKK